MKFAIDESQLLAVESPQPTPDATTWALYENEDGTVHAKLFVRSVEIGDEALLAERCMSDVFETISKHDGDVRIVEAGVTDLANTDRSLFSEFEETHDERTTTHLVVTASAGAEAAVLRVVFPTALTPLVRNEAIRILRSLTAVPE